MSRAALVMSLAVAAVGCWSIARPAHAEDLTLTFDTLGDPSPQVVCILASFISVRGATPWNPETALAAWAKLLSPPDKPSDRELSRVEHATDAFCAPADTSSPADGLGRAVIIEIEQANIGGIELAANTVRVNFTPIKNASGPATVKVLGGDFHGSTAVPVRAFDSSQRLSIELIPRRSRRAFSAPYVKKCGAGSAFKLSENVRALGSDFKPITSKAIPAFVEIDNRPQSGGSLEFWMCNEETHFRSEWNTKVPPQPLPIRVVQFRLYWSRSCMATLQECPDLSMIGQAGRCSFVKDESTPNRCKYKCDADGKIEFPVELRFSESFDYLYTGETLSGEGDHEAKTQTRPKQADAAVRKREVQTRWITGSWTESLQYPRQGLNGYLPSDQRRLRLDWHDVTKGDIAYVEMRSADGKLLRVEHGQPSIAISELACGDLVAYRFVGERRLYSESQQGVDHGTLHLIEPTMKLGDLLSLGLALGGGFRHVSGTERIQWRPYLEGQATFILRLPDWINFQLDVLRVSGVFAAQPFCSVFREGNATNADCRSDQWTFPFFWRIPVDTGFTYYFSKFPLSAGTGIAASRDVNSHDSSRLASGPLFTLRASIGYEFVRGFAFEFQTRYFYGERYLRTRFDELGTVDPHSTHPNSTPHSLFIGLNLRYSDLVSTTPF